MSDLIRQAAIALAKDICVSTGDGGVYRTRSIDPQEVRELPAVQPDHTADVSKKVERTDETAQNVSDSDLISRKAVTDALAKFVPYAICDESTESYANGLTDAYNLILQLPSAQPEPHWIPCSERLPENDNEVLITVWDAEDDYAEVYKGFYQEHEWWTQWCHGCSKIKDEPCGENIVIAWMPLPEPYRGGDE